MVAISYIASLDAVLMILGLVNQLLCRQRFKTATLFYFADARYLEASTFPWYARLRKWRPCLAGGFTLGDVGGLTCVVGACEREILDEANLPRLLALHARMGRMARLLRVPTVSYSGILPSVLARSGVDRAPIEVDRTVHWVVHAVRQLLSQGVVASDAAVLVLGASGFVGGRLCDALRAQIANEVIEVDPLHPDVNARDPRNALTCMSATVQPGLVVDVSRNGVLEQYAELICPGSVVLNEVYPEADAETVAKLKRRGVRYFHLQGVKGQSWPAFPGAYAGAVPFCAASAAGASRKTGGVISEPSHQVLMYEQ